MVEALVAGAGPAGLAAAAHTRHTDLTIVERMKKPGHPPHCSGIVSEATATRLTMLSRRSLYSEDLVESVYRRAIFLDERLMERCTVEANPLAVKLARPRLEHYLAKMVQDLGHHILYSTSLVGVAETAGTLEATIVQADTARRLSAKRLLLATGAQGYNTLSGMRCWKAYGLEERLLLPKRVDEETFTTIHGTRLAPQFFAWIAPIRGGREAAVGLAAPTPRGLHARLEELKKRLARAGLLPATARTLSRRGGVILRGPPARRAASAATARLGDALCASKPYTGGGLYAIVALAPAAARWLETGDPHALEEPWSRLRRELLLQHVAARAAVAAPRLFLRLLARACAKAARGECSIDYDRHSSLLRCLL